MSANGSNARRSETAPTRSRKRIYDHELNPEEETGCSSASRRMGLYTGYHETIKGVAPYKKGERLARYARRPDSLTIVSASTHGPQMTAAICSTSSAVYDPSKSPMMEDEEVNQGLADNFDDSLCGLGTELSSSTYNMSEALNALQNVPNIKLENLPAKMESLMSGGGTSSINPAAIFDDSSQNNSIDRLFRLLTNDEPTHNMASLFQQNASQNSSATAAAAASSASSIFSPSPSEDALSPPSPPLVHHPHHYTITPPSSHTHHQHHNSPIHIGSGGTNNGSQDHLPHHSDAGFNSSIIEANVSGPPPTILTSHQTYHVMDGDGSSTSIHIPSQAPSSLNGDDHRTDKPSTAASVLALSVGGMPHTSSASSGVILQEEPLDDVVGASCKVEDSLDSTGNRRSCDGDPAMRLFTLDGVYDQGDRHMESYDDNRFQYILSVPTTTAVKRTEDTLSYLNQGQPYEIKIKKLGDITKCAGKKFTSLIRICFHERRFQYIEKEQLSLWHQVRPNERIIEMEVPLCYGITDVVQPKNKLAVVQFDWDPNKDVAAYIKVNCISTEFTQRKHGGEKGVPFRIQIETYSNDNGKMERLNVCGCQIKVFKLKGADRKHKQDREKIAKLPLTEKDKYQESCECTILTTYTGDMIYSPDDSWSTTSAEHQMSANTSTASEVKASVSSLLPHAPVSVKSPTHTSSPAPPPHSSSASSSSYNNKNNSPSPEQMKMFNVPSSCNASFQSFRASHERDIQMLGGHLQGDESATFLQQWLSLHRFSHYAHTFANFAATDILRLSRGELIEICGLVDGIRLFNALHAKNVVPRVTLYVRTETESVYSAVYLETATYRELVKKITPLLNLSVNSVNEVYMQGPNGIHVKLNDEVVRNFQDECLIYVTSLPSSPTDGSEACHTLVLKVQTRESICQYQSPTSTFKINADYFGGSHSASGSHSPPSKLAHLAAGVGGLIGFAGENSSFLTLIGKQANSSDNNVNPDNYIEDLSKSVSNTDRHHHYSGNSNNSSCENSRHLSPPPSSATSTTASVTRTSPVNTEQPGGGSSSSSSSAGIVYVSSGGAEYSNADMRYRSS